MTFLSPNNAPSSIEQLFLIPLLLFLLLWPFIFIYLFPAFFGIVWGFFSKSSGVDRITRFFFYFLIFCLFILLLFRIAFWFGINLQTCFVLGCANVKDVISITPAVILSILLLGFISMYIGVFLKHLFKR